MKYTEFTGIPSMSWFTKFFIWLGIKQRPIVDISSHFNGSGFPEAKNMTWNYCSKYYSINPCYFGKYITFYYVPPKWCPECKVDLIEEKWDEWMIENTKQFMVYSYTCPNGHGHYVEWS